MIKLSHEKEGMYSILEHGTIAVCIMEQLPLISQMAMFRAIKGLRARLGPSWNIYRRLEERMCSIMELKAIGFKYLARGVPASLFAKTCISVLSAFHSSQRIYLSCALVSFALCNTDCQIARWARKLRPGRFTNLDLFYYVEPFRCPSGCCAPMVLPNQRPYNLLFRYLQGEMNPNRNYAAVRPHDNDLRHELRLPYGTEAKVIFLQEGEEVSTTWPIFGATQIRLTDPTSLLHTCVQKKRKKKKAKV